MYRFVYEELLEWKNSKYRKPLILNGARQVGKTWLLKEFGANEYDSVAYINCDNNPQMEDIFVDFDIERIIRSLSVISNTRIEKEKTLIIIDEIQQCPLGLTALKYFCEKANEYHIAVAGSLLGVSVHKGTGFPVGKTNQITMYPMSFHEFLLALGKDILIENIKNQNWSELSTLENTFIDLLRQYYYVGGMPEVVSYYSQTNDCIGTRKIQEQILEDYKRDFSKHVPNTVLPKLMLVWNSIPAQLSRENKKFIYGALKKGGRAKEFEDAIEWLVNAGLVYKVTRINKICKPIKFYEDINAFKLYLLDLGLLGAMSDTNAKDVLIGNSVFEEYKGAFTEQYVLQQLLFCERKPYYFNNENSTNEIDFVIETNEVHPIEVKAEKNLKSKSLNLVLKENPTMQAWKFSMSKYRKFSQITDVPLYLIQEWIKAN
jgi:predicted AAA+ superfamily ATPase